jgi:hypothetical protein
MKRWPDAKAQLVTYLSSALVVALVVATAAWMIMRDYHAAVENAEHHLENFAVVVAQQSAFALRTTSESALAALLQKAARSRARTRRIPAALDRDLRWARPRL